MDLTNFRTRHREAIADVHALRDRIRELRRTASDEAKAGNDARATNLRNDLNGYTTDLVRGAWKRRHLHLIAAFLNKTPYAHAERTRRRRPLPDAQAMALLLFQLRDSADLPADPEQLKAVRTAWIAGYTAKFAAWIATPLAIQVEEAPCVSAS